MTYYELLGIPRTAKPEEIQSALDAGVARINSGHLDDSVRDEKLLALKKAFAVLSNDTSREIYDNLLDKGEWNFNPTFRNVQERTGNPPGMNRSLKG